MWTTRMHWNGNNWMVYLMRDDKHLVAKMSLDEWAQLSATTFLLDDRDQQAQAEQPAAARSAAVPCRE